MPLPDSPWERGKCGFKLIQYMAAGLPVVASPVGVNDRIVSPGVGYLALYNVMFVLPLIAILLAAGNRVTAKAWAGWERQNALNIRLWYGVTMVSLGAIVLLWMID